MIRHGKVITNNSPEVSHQIDLEEEINDREKERKYQIRIRSIEKLEEIKKVREIIRKRMRLKETETFHGSKE